MAQGRCPEEVVEGRSGHGSSNGGRGERSPEPKRPGSPGQAAADGGRTPSLKFLLTRKEMLTKRTDSKIHPRG